MIQKKLTLLNKKLKKLVNQKRNRNDIKQMNNNQIEKYISELDDSYKCYDVHVQTYSLKDVHTFASFSSILIMR